LEAAGARKYDGWCWFGDDNWCIFMCTTSACACANWVWRTSTCCCREDMAPTHP
jgi:hypothetical protein